MATTLEKHVGAADTSNVSLTVRLIMQGKVSLVEMYNLYEMRNLDKVWDKVQPKWKYQTKAKLSWIVSLKHIFQRLLLPIGISQ